MTDEGGLRPLDLLASGAGMVEGGLHAAAVLGRARLARPVRPDRPPRALAAVHRWGFTPAGGFAAAAALYPDAEAIVDERGALTFAELDDRSNRLANAFSDAGVLEGDGVGVMARNHRGFVEAIVALSKLGADAMLLNTAFAGPQLTEVVKREKPRAIVYDAEFAELLEDALYRRKGFVAWHDEDDEVSDPTLEALISDGDASTPVAPDREGRQTILTSGTTGTPKGASRGSPGIGAAVAILSAIPLRGREKVLIAPPLFHQWGFAHFGLAMLTASTMVLRRKFDPKNVLETIERERIDSVPMVPVMLQRILDLDDEDRRGHDTSSLRTVPVSGSALSGDLARRFMDEFGDVVYNLYGSTEVAWVAIAGPKDLRDAPGTAGRPPRNTELAILGDDDDRPLRTGETGRIFVKNSMLFEGYTGGGSKDMVDGMMATGDVGRLDEEGRLFVEGRDDDMIVSGGENVFPQEVEEALAAHANVAEAAVVGVDDEKWGQALKAYVVKKGSVSESALKKHVKDNLAGYKVPQEIEFIDELPRNPAGKVLKRELEDDDDE